MYKLKITKEAQSDLRKEIRYSKKKWGASHARTYHQDIKKHIANLKNNPLLYTIRNDILPDVRIKTYKGTQIVYTIRKEEKMIIVLAVLSTYQSAAAQTNLLAERQKKIKSQ